MIDLSAKTAIITGGSRGIGAATARLFAQFGCRVLIDYHTNEAAAAETVRQIRQLGQTAETFRADVSNLVQCQALAKRCIKLWGQIDILVNNAGIWEEARIETLTEVQLRKMVDCNLFGLFFPTMAVVPHMIKRQSGIIVNISSTAGQRGETNHSHYAATKGAVISATKSWATELIDDNIRVNCVAPGWVDTEMSEEALNSPDRDRHLRLIPLGRPATPDEIANAVLYLASDASSFVVGEILNVNGGAVLCG